MKKKNVRYNFLIICLVFLIGIVGAFSTLILSGSSSADASDGEIPTDLIDTTDDDSPTLVVVDAPDENATPLERVEFAVGMLSDGNGFTSYLYQTVNAMGQVQKMAYKKYRGGGLDLTEEYYEMTGMMSSLGKNEFKSYYSDGTNMKYKYISNSSNFSFANKTYKYTASDDSKDFTAAEYESTKNKLNNFFTTINENTISSISRATSDGKNYSITVVCDVKKLDAKYLSNFTSNGAASLDIKSLIITFKIDQKTGLLANYEKIESFSASYLGLQAVCENHLKETFLTMNKSAESTIKSITSQSFKISY